MLFESECAFFMSAALAPTTVATTTASLLVATTTSQLTEATKRTTALSSSYSSDGTFSNGFFNIEQPQELVFDCGQHQQQQQHQPEQLPKLEQEQHHKALQIEQQQQQQPSQQQPEHLLKTEQEPLPEQPQNRQDSLDVQKDQLPQTMEVEVKQNPLQDQPAEVAKPTKKKKAVLREKHQTVDILPSPSKLLDFVPSTEQLKSASAPEAATTKQKSSAKLKAASSTGSGSKKISPKTRKVSLASIIFRQLMAAGGQGIGVGIDKDLPFPARQRPPPRAAPAGPAEGSGVKKSSTKASISNTKGISSDSSGDPMPEHFGSAIEEC
ncbi:uncharacterized protein LOC128722839 [Anopheles nili]|uniref:uncharacterized protein LOC128722839 n=1 Tax=Anopheles nili TaxID=185578 RepID=UPI00237AFF89|nr:uncharacterized protein LOC128722839 [Anopheles nili]